MRLAYGLCGLAFFSILSSCTSSEAPQKAPAPSFQAAPSTPQRQPLQPTNPYTQPNRQPSSPNTPSFVFSDPTEPNPLVFSEPAFSKEGSSTFTQEERSYISDMNTIIEQVAKPMSFEEMTQLFAMAGGIPRTSKFILFGERHSEVPTLMLKARALHNLASSGDLILFEGNNAGKAWYCDDVVRDIYTAREYTASGFAYDPKLYELMGSRHFSIHLKTKAQLNLYKLSFINADCAFWDDLSAFTLEPKARSLSMRNASLVAEASRHQVGVYNHIFIIAGAFHTPTGDLDRFRDSYLRYPDMQAFNVDPLKVATLRPAQYYKVLRNSIDPKAKAEIESVGYGSTEAVFDFFKSRSFSELIPAAVLNATEPCGPACD